MRYRLIVFLILNATLLLFTGMIIRSNSLYAAGAAARGDKNNFEYTCGGITRGDTTQKKISIVFTGHEFADGFSTIKAALDKQDVKASFFFTGDFYRNKNLKTLIEQLINDGHYLGAHSDKHLLYASWEKRDSTLVSKDELIKDIEDNYSEMKSFGITKSDARIFLPPYEWYNDEINKWVEESGLKIANFTPGTLSNADYTIPSMDKRYISSDSIYNHILNFEAGNKYGLNGVILLMHIGTSPERTDKFYNRLYSLISELKSRGYSFERIDDALKP